MLIASTTDQVHIAQALTIRAALRLYARTGIQANRAYTPKAMIAAARRITGLELPARGYTQAAEALTRWIEAQKGGL